MKAELVAWLTAQIDADPDFLGAAIKREILNEVFEYEDRIDGEWGDCHTADQIRAGECDNPDDLPIVRLLGLIYRDNPGYRDEWRPEGAWSGTVEDCASALVGRDAYDRWLHDDLTHHCVKQTGHVERGDGLHECERMCGVVWYNMTGREVG